MRLASSILLALIAVIQPAFAADDRSPYDKNPACLDRNVDSNKPECVIKDDGKPRQKYPPRKTTATPGAPAAPAAAPAPAREAAPASGRKGG